MRENENHIESQQESIRFFVLSLGYVESSTLPVMLLKHRDGFATAWDAMRSLGQMLTEWAQSSVLPCSKAKCPRSFDTPHCPECGVGKVDMTYIDIYSYVEKMWTLSLNGLHYFWEHFEDHGWGVAGVQELASESYLRVEDFGTVMMAVAGFDEIHRDPENMGFLFQSEYPVGKFYPLREPEEGAL